MDAFARYRQSRPEPGMKAAGPNLLLVVLALAVAGVWYFAAPRVVGKSHVGLSVQQKDRLPDGVLTIVQLDVGQGDATFIHTPGGYNILIDCGEGLLPENAHSRQYASAKYVVQPFLELHGIYDLDMLVLTHPDSDHGGGMADLIHWIYERGGKIHKFLVSGVVKPAAFYEEILAAVEKHDVPFYPVLDPKTGEPVHYDEFGGTLIGRDPLGDPTIAYQILGPHDRIGSADGDKSNDNSVITRIQCGDISFLSAGDAETEQEDEAVAFWGPRLQSTIHFPPHHGSKTSDEPNWLKMVQPRYISTSSHPPVFGHPAADAIQAWKTFIKPLPLLLRTDMQGDIWYRTDGSRLAIRTQFPVQSPEAQWEPAKRGEWNLYRAFEPNEPTIWGDCVPVPGTDEL